MKLNTFVTDGDGHWFFIPIEKELDFERWLDELQEVEDPDYDKFSEYLSEDPTSYNYPITLEELEMINR